MFIILFITHILIDVACAGTISPSIFKAYQTTDTTFSNEVTSLKINTQYLIRFEFDLPTTLSVSTDYIRIDVVGFKSMAKFFQSYQFTNPSADGTTFLEFKADTSTKIQTPLIIFYATTGASTKTHTCSALSYRTPGSTTLDTPTKTFTIIGGSITFSSSISVPNKVFGQKSLYIISLNFENSLSEGTNKYITFPKPSGLTADATISCSGTPSTTISCTWATGTNLITITNLDSTKTQTISLEFTNPPSPTSSVTFNTLITYIDTFQVDSSSTSQIVTGYNDGIITTLSLESGTQKVGQSGSYLKYKFTSLNDIVTGSIIQLTLPSDIQWSTTSPSCSWNTGSVTACSSNFVSTQVISITLTLSAPIPGGTSLILTINSIRTPYTFSPSTGFSFMITQGGVQYDQNTNFGSLTMTEQSGITLAFFSRTENKNGAKSDYKFSIKFDTKQPSGTKITYTLQGYDLSNVNAVDFTGSTQLTSPTTLLVISTAYTITFQLSSELNENQNYDTIIYKIVNKNSAGTITAETTKNNFKISTTDKGTAGTLPSSTPNEITIVNMIQEKKLLGVVDSYQFRITLSNLLSAGSTIIVTMPDNFSAEDVDCTTYVDNIEGLTVDTCSVNSKEITIKIKIAIQVNTIQFRFNSLIRNPKIYSSNYQFKIRTQKDNAIIDELLSSDSAKLLEFKLLCAPTSTVFCKECDAQGKCLSCYSDTSITQYIYFLSNQCLSTCGSKYYSDSSNKCQGCPNYCQECTSSSLCQSCENETTQEIKNGKCVLKCTENQFDFNGICTPCNENCNTCVDQSTKCTSCGETNNLLYQNKCVSQCPTGVFQVGFSCIACTSPCKTCDTGPTICLTCVANYYYKKASLSCVSDCGNRYFKDGSDCTLCSDPCNNCLSNTICVDCLTGYYFFNNSCVSTVPNGYYKSGTTLNKCPDICGNCISETECTSCPTNKYLLAKQCQDKCPDKYYSQNFVCYACDTSCLQCSSSTVCTQCPENQQHLTGKCYQNCPNKYYSLDYQCLSCQSSCATCVNGLECKTCPVSSPYMLNSLCVQTCQSNYYIKEYVCNKCANECATCDEKGCLTCVQNYKQLDQTCVTSCPTGYQDLNNIDICEKVTDTEQQVISNLQENKYIPVPFTIVSLIMILSVVVAKIQKTETFIPGSAVGLLGLIIIGSWAVLLLLQLDYLLEKLETYLLMAAIGVHILLNLINLCVVKHCTQGDTVFNLWYSARKSNSCAYIFLNLLSILSFSMTRFYFSRYFGFRFLKCKLSDVENMVGMNIINGLCAFFCCIPALIASVLLAYRDQLREQLFISSIDSFIVTIIFGICLIWETQKEEHFFEDIHYASVSQSHQVIPEFFQTNRSKQSKRFSFEDSMNGQKFNHHEQDEEPSFPKIDESIEYKDPNYSSQQPFQKMLQKNSQFTFKQDILDPKQDNSNRYQEEVVLQMPNNDVSEPLSIGESQRDQFEMQQKQTLEQQQQQKILEEQQRIEFEKQQEKLRQIEEQNNIEEQKKKEIQKQQEEQQRQEEIKKQELERQAELKRIEEEKQQQEQIKQQELEKNRKEKELQIQEEQKKQQELIIQQQQEEERIAKQKEEERQAFEKEEALKLEKQKEEEKLALEREEEQRIEQQKQEERLELERQDAQRLEQQKEEERLAELNQKQKTEEAQRAAEQQKIEEEQQAERLRQEELKLKEQEEEAKRIQEEQKKQEELRIQQELEQKKKDEDLNQLLEEQKLQEQKEQEMLQRQKQSRQAADQNSEIDVMQNEIEDLKQEINEFDQNNNNKLNDIILVDQDDDDVGWDIENEEVDDQAYDQGVTAQQKKFQKEIIQDDKNDADDDWDVPTSGFVSVQPKSQLKKDQQIEEPINPFKGYNQKQAAESDLFKQSREDSDDEDWAPNQISPSEFNILNQRFDHEKHSITQAERSKKFSQTGQNFKSVIKRPTLPEPQTNSDNESIDQQSVFDQFARNQLNQIPKKQNQGLNKIYLQRQQIKQKGTSNIGINDIKF
ncbi:unnamed protein product (macronuclear) [Paramecium tetraurelia]|uniref:EGF-like domain-containing protein n=1 Tax=Paramecium tetraurelia TaxID=5888 RepID=A0D221_PARTE|nr:uncharacterized protein GSPATT00012594001 [Paramecium tetraurelia]CAK77088.1 unnamed protein product [Paramecium tetraurelia]|eukprot:XP_001444485.1 hypothetical protein (macronuclear) [Paramecium tetraurelia strain d4-2]